MDIENIIYKLRRALDRRIQQLAISVSSGGVDNMNTYKYITGQINALEAVKQEISNLLDEKEPYDANRNIVEIPKGNSTHKPKN
jgi:ribosome maturation factor RimP